MTQPGATPTEPQTRFIETACPECGHDIDHIGSPCPKACPACTPVAVTIIGTNIVYDHGTEERARLAFDMLR